MKRVHIVGAGLAGLACAVALARSGIAVSLYEAAGQAGGRCRSYHDARLGCLVDNGNHILLSANRAALSYLEEIGARDSLTGPAEAVFPFYDLRSGAHWLLRPNAGRLPWWIFCAARRVPDSRPGGYLAALRLAGAARDATVADCLDPSDPLWERFWEPLTVAALNTNPQEASARLLWLVLRETFGRGGAACRPLIAREGLGPSFVEPALALLRRAGAEVRFNRRLRSVEFAGDRAVQMSFGDEAVGLGAADFIVLAVPPAAAVELLPGLQAPDEMRPIVNAHIRLPEPPRLPPGMSAALPLLGLVGGLGQWLLLRGPVASLTVSAAAEAVEEPAEALAERLWAETAQSLGLAPAPAPPVRVVKERRATFAQTPAALDRRPPVRTAWRNLALAGDWTDTGYPATIESAVRSGRAAAQLVTTI